MMTQEHHEEVLPCLFRIEIILKGQHCGAFAVFLVPCFPRLNLAFLAAIPLGLALGTLLKFLARLCAFFLQLQQ